MFIYVSAGLALSFDFTRRMISFLKAPQLNSKDINAIQKQRDYIKDTNRKLKKLKKERSEKDKILITSIEELDSKEAITFLDFNLKPGLAFLDKSANIKVFSAVCTHLGCTVSSRIDPEGRILCPCHSAYFDSKTGKNESGPAPTGLKELKHTIESNKLYLVKGEI